MRYIGSKSNILDFLEETILSCVKDREGMTFADLFAGTTIVSQLFKKLGYRIISNDYMAFSYILQLAFIKNSYQPKFKKMNNNYLNIIDELNSLKPIKSLFYENYCLKQASNSEYQRNYFSITNAGKIDAIMSRLKEWKISGDISAMEDAILRASLIDAATKVSNISGTYAAFLKDDDPRKNKPLKLEPILFIQSSEDNDCHNKDTLSLIDNISGDILYLDPPYNQRQYPPYYHILESIALDDNPSIYGKTGRRPYKDKLSPFCIKTKVHQAFIDLMNKARFQHIFLSYNTEGLMPLDELESILSRQGETKVFYYDHRRYRSNANGQKHRRVREVLYYVHKK